MCDIRQILELGELFSSLDPPKWDLPMNFELPRPSKLALPMSFLDPLDPLKWVSSFSHLASGTPTSKKIAALGIHPTG